MPRFPAPVHAILLTALSAGLVAASPVAAQPASAVPLPAPEVQVPFGCGLTFPVSQAHNVGSHSYNDVWAWDFRMPEGTPVVAAQDGVVRMARGDSTAGGCDPVFASFANYVVLTHPDGTETQYLHFREVTAKVGDRVKAGDLLGYSGKTGWACGPHLHFKVARPTNAGWNNPSVPARIAGYGDPQAEVLIAAPICKDNGVRYAAASPPVPESKAVAKQDAQATGLGASPAPPSAKGNPLPAPSAVPAVGAQSAQAVPAAAVVPASAVARPADPSL